jgi:hypothetical protein
MPFGGIPQLSIGHKLSGHSQLDYDIISFPKSKEEFSLFYLKNWNFSDKSHPNGSKLSVHKINNGLLRFFCRLQMTVP